MPKYGLPSQLYNFKKLSTNHNLKKKKKNYYPATGTINYLKVLALIQHSS